MKIYQMIAGLCRNSKFFRITKNKFPPLLICMGMTFSALQTLSQVNEITEKAFYQVKFIPNGRLNTDSYGKPIYKQMDSAYSSILKLGVRAIPLLMAKMNDTALTNIVNPCDNDKLMRYGDLAWFLVQDIERIPLFAVTKMQWCVWGACEHFPQGFFESLNFSRSKFSKQYANYFHSRERQRFIKKRATLK
jgi:hypothetical protein